ncbi:MAG: hypothetical protein EP329_19870 [Deltaproteobacteria bacterium]|nr:MAG: hypothetical protein EP329_19870 [Deltaproteobacteria bacterium]
MRFSTTMKKLFTFSALAALTGAVTLGGCADPEQIDRVQPDLIEKASLAGEWYSMTTVVRAPYASAEVFPGLQGLLERGVWEIEQNNLYFYRTYEFVEGVESQGIRADIDTPLLDADGNPVTYEKTFPDGTVHTVTRYVYRSAPLRRYGISGHFDVRRNYNPMTGEESNVRLEDASEKYWYQRDYMRVDFGSNSADNFADLSLGNAPVIYDGQEGPDDWMLHRSADGTYLDFVVRGFMTAPRTYFEGWGYVPTCLFFPWYTGAYYECDEEEIHLRSSFMKVADDNTYVPMNYNDHMLNKFGYYRSSRAHFDQFYGTTFSDALRYIRRFNIWEEVKKDAAGGIAYGDMAGKPIVYYLSEDFPRELIAGAIDLADQWNEPFAETVETLTGRDAPRMFILCENNQAEVDAILAADPNATLASTDATYCKDMDQPKRLGDLRYNLLVSINDPVQFGLYGYGPMNPDPITGETVHANAFMYTGNIRLGARTAVDMIEYEAGVQNFRDITQARHIETSLKARALQGAQNDPRALGLAEAQSMAGLVMAPEIAADLSSVGLSSVDTDIATANMNRLLQTSDFDALWMNPDMAAVVGLPVDDLGADLTKVQGSSLLQSIVHPAHLGSEASLKSAFEEDLDRGKAAICMKEFFDNSIRGLALEYKAVYDDVMCTQLAADMEAGADYIFNFNAFKEPGASCDADPNSCGANQECRFLDQGDYSGNYCMTPCSAGALLGQLRKEIRRVNEISQFAYWDPNALYTDTKDARVSASQIAARTIIEAKREEVFAEVYDKMWSTVAMHEVGHNLGLRHNFASSTDALNFFPEFWDQKGHDDGGDWQPYAVFSDDTESQVRGRMREYQQTSIMEYTAAFNARYAGLGEYDRAAILFGYGNLVEVFSNPPTYSEWEKYLADPAKADPDNFDIDGQRREQPFARALRKLHYTRYPNLFGGVSNLLDRKVVPAASLADKTKPCNQHDDPYDASVCGGGGSFCQPFVDGFFCTKPDMLEVPLRFCSDEYNWTTPDCQTWDEGTDVFEIVNNSLADYDAYWPFRAYRRDNALFNPMTSYWNGVMYNMYGWRKQFEHWALSYARFNKNDWWENQYGQRWEEDVNGGLGETLAMTRLFDYLANIFGRPDDAYYGWNEERQIYEPIIDNGRNTYCNVFQVREDQGARPMYPSYDFDGYLYTPARAGTFYDRLGAIMFMTYPTTMFTIGVDRAYDLKRFRLNFATVWPQRMHNLLSGLLLSEPSMYGWCIEHDSAETPENNQICTIDPVKVKKRMWFGTTEELDDYYANCKALNPEPEYTFPTTQYRIPALAAIYGYAWMSGTFDRSFIDRNRLWLAGDGTDITIPDGWESISYTDPYSGKTYIAAYDPNEEDPYAEVLARDVVPDADRTNVKATVWSAARLVALANTELARYGGNLSELSADYQFSTLQQTVGRLEILRGLYRLFDFGF